MGNTDQFFVGYDSIRYLLKLNELNHMYKYVIFHLFFFVYIGTIDENIVQFMMNFGKFYDEFLFSHFIRRYDLVSTSLFCIVFEFILIKFGHLFHMVAM